MKITLFLFLILLPVFIQAQEFEKYKKITDSLFLLHQNDKAIRLMEEELKLYPRNKDLLSILGQLYIGINNFDIAEKYFIETKKINPGCSHCFCYLGIIEWNRNNKEKAMELIDKSIRIDPKESFNYSKRASIKEFNGYSFSALSDINKAIELEPLNVEYIIQRGEYYMRQNFTSKALVDFDKASILDPENYLPHYRKVEIYYSENRMEEALKEAEIAISLNSLEANSFLGRGTVYSALGKHELAKADFFKAMELDKKSYHAIYYYALEEYAMEDMDGYCNDLHKCYAMALEEKADSLYLEDMLVRIGNICDSARASYYYQRGVAFYNKGEYQKAVEMYEKGLLKYPKNSMLYSFMGNAKMSLEKYEEALTSYDKALLYKEDVKEELVNNPNFKNADLTNQELYKQGFIATMYVSIAQSWCALAEYEKAKEAIDKGISLAPVLSDFGMENYYYVRANVLMGMKKYELALQDFDKVLSYQPLFASAHLGKALSRLNMTNILTMEFVLSEVSSMNPNQLFYWELPVDLKIKKSDESILKALEDCNKVIEIVPDFAYIYLVRGQIKKILKQADYCLDFIKAKELGYSVFPALLENCSR